jgi:hypothetical protein
MNMFRVETRFFLVLATVFFLSACSGEEPAAPPEPCSLAITTPVAAEMLWLGTPADVRWNQTGGAAEVRLQLAQAGAVLGDITPATPNDGYFSWHPNAMGGDLGPDYSILIDVPGDSACVAASPAFRLAECGLQMNTGSWPAQIVSGDTLQIFWQSTDTSGRVDIDLMKGGQVVGNIATNRVDDGDVSWVVDTFNEGTSDAYLIRVRDHLVAGCESSSRLLRIRQDVVCSLTVSSPSQFQTVAVGEVLTIAWSGFNTSASVRIELYDGQGWVGEIVNQVPTGQAVYEWTASLMGATEPSSQYFVRVTDALDQSCWNSSLGFLIEP